VREVTLRIRHHGEPESDISAAYPGVTLRSRSSMTGRTAERKRIIEVSGDPEQIPPFLEEFAAADAIVALEPLTPVDGDRVFVAMTYDAYQWDSIAERLSNLGVHYRNGTTINAGWERWTLYLGEDDDLSEIVEHLSEAGNDTELVRDVDLSEVRANEQLDLTRLARELTPRQGEVLATAIRSGYYQPDRDTSIEEIGEQLGISRTTAWEHLKRAEGKVMDEIYESLETQI
jgi:predicted DNA binding protein